MDPTAATGSTHAPHSPAKTLLHEEQALELKEAFDLFDNTGSGIIDVAELRTVMRIFGCEPRKNELEQLLTVTSDGNRSGTVPSVVTYQQYIEIMSKKMSQHNTQEDIEKAFLLFDIDDTGKITFENLKHVAMELGENITDAELQEMIDEADRDGDGKVGKEEFMRLMKKTSMR